MEEKEKKNNMWKILEIDKNKYILLYMPETLNIIEYIYEMHKEDGHKGIISLRKYLIQNHIYFEGNIYYQILALMLK